MECYQVYMDFKAQVDAKLEEFIAAQPGNLTSEVIMESLLRIQEADPGLLSCIDYLMAAADYQDFINLMLDFRDGFDWDGDDQQVEGDDVIAEEGNEAEEQDEQIESEEQLQN